MAYTFLKEPAFTQRFLSFFFFQLSFPNLVPRISHLPALCALQEDGRPWNDVAPLLLFCFNIRREKQAWSAPNQNCALVIVAFFLNIFRHVINL